MLMARLGVLPQVTPRRLQRDLYLFTHAMDENDPAPALLGIRAARQALAVNPDDPDTYLRLFMLYEGLSTRTRERQWNLRGPIDITQELRQRNVPTELRLTPQMIFELGQIRRIQATAAMHQGVTLASEYPRIHETMANVYRDAQCRDLELRHRSLALELTKKTLVDDPENPKKRQDEEEMINKRLDAIEGDLKALEGEYAKEAEKLKRPLDRALLARAYGLVEKALQIALPLGKEKEDQTPEVIRLQLELLLQTGRIDELISRFCGPDGRLGADFQGGLGEWVFRTGWTVPAGAWFSLQLAAATGDYAEADRVLGQMLKPDNPKLRPLDPTLDVVQGIGDELQEKLQPKPFAQAARWWAASRPPAEKERVPPSPPGFLLKEAQAIVVQRGNLLALRGLLALEAGHPGKAREYFKAILPPEDRPTEGEEPFGCVEMARYYLELFERTAR
jgi:hypothetical protein